VAEGIWRTIRCNVEPGSNYHVEVRVKETLDKGRRATDIVGVVTVRDNVDVCVYFGEHSAQYVTFSP
jgi:hypothetical protein